MDTPACQGKGWKAATCAVKWQQPEAASAFLPPLLQKDRLPRWGLQGESEHVWELGAESGTAIFAMGQSSCRSFPAWAAVRAGQGRRDGSCPAESPALSCPLLGGDGVTDDGDCKK